MINTLFVQWREMRLLMNFLWYHWSIISTIRYYVNVHQFICHQINKMLVKEWRICLQSHGYYDQSDTSISKIVEVKETNEIAVHDHIKTRWINFYPSDSTGDDFDLHLSCSSLYICMVDWYDEEFNFWPIDTSHLQREKKRLKDEDVRKGFKRFIQTGLVPYYTASSMKKKNKSSPCSYDSVHPLALLHPTSVTTSVNIFIWSQDAHNMLIAG